MSKAKLFTSAVLSALLAYNVASATVNFNDVPEEEIARAVASVLKKNPQIAYDAVVEYHKMQKKNAVPEEKKLTPLEEKLAEVLKDNPALVMGAIQIYEQNKQQEELLAKAESYKVYVADINSDEIFAGNPNGKYVLAEFFDFACGYCKQMAPRIKKLIENNPDLKVVFKPVAFLSKSSEIAARASIAASKQGKFLDMYVKIMQEVRPNENSIEKIAKDLKLDMRRYKDDFSSKETTELLAKIRKTADNIKITSVPTLVLNGMPLYAVEEVQLQRAIDVLRNSK
ncbi:MAG: thioredoxin domain-containing protein [Alphaproteobacteria bacterium]|nr:thioredoxin domain-containing protein [Alphaproteobacteria bacterium]